MLNAVSGLVVKLFYPRVVTNRPVDIVATVLIPQKILRINGKVPWPVHPTSRVLHHRNIKVGARSFPGFNIGCYVQGRNGIEIGDNFRMGPGVGLISANHDPDDYDKRVDSPPIKIGDNVWIGMNSVVLPGVTIGSDTIIGAGSVVTDDIPECSVAVGNPCRVIRKKGAYKGPSFSKKP